MCRLLPRGPSRCLVEIRIIGVELGVGVGVALGAGVGVGLGVGVGGGVGLRKQADGDRIDNLIGVLVAEPGTGELEDRVAAVSREGELIMLKLDGGGGESRSIGRGNSLAE
jgi:hypothetical protein